MRKLLIFFLLAGTSLLMYGFRGTGWQGDMHKRTYDADDDGVVDSAEITIVAGADVRDTIDAWWGDTSAIYSTVVALEDSADAVRADARDTINTWWGDTSAIYSTVVALEDSTDAAREDGGDSAAVHADAARADAGDTAAVYAGDSIALAVRKDGSVALTANWAAGDFDITGLEKVEADTIEGTYADIDTIGASGSTVIGDTIILPLWNNKAATASVGAMGLDTTGTDTLWIYTQAGWLPVAND